MMKRQHFLSPIASRSDAQASSDLSSSMLHHAVAQPSTRLSRLTQALHLAYRYSLVMGISGLALSPSHAELIIHNPNTADSPTSLDTPISNPNNTNVANTDTVVATESSTDSATPPNDSDTAISDASTDSNEIDVTTQTGRTPISAPPTGGESARTRPNYVPNTQQQASLERLASFYQPNDQQLPTTEVTRPSDSADASSTVTNTTSDSADGVTQNLTPTVINTTTPAITNAPMCRGTWVYPSSSFHAADAQAAAKTDRPNSSFPLYAEADYGYYDNDTYAELSGNVQVNQGRQQIAADKVVVNLQDGVAAAQGNVLLVDTGQSGATPVTSRSDIRNVEGGIITVADEVAYQTDSSKATARDVAFASVSLQAHGYAKQLNKISESQYQIDEVMFTTCDPVNPTWQINAKNIDIDTDTGRGEARGATLKVKNTPILYLPYFNFPIDDRRTSGFLIPRFGFSTDGGVNLQTPYYFNLAPNYDATLTPSVFSNRNPMLTGEFRYLTRDYGAGNITGSYLPSDRQYNDEDRSSLFYQHRWQSKDIPTLSAEAVYQYVSDSAYFNDFDTMDSLNTLGNQLNLPRRIQANYYNDYLTALAKFETFQTLSSDLTGNQEVLDKDKPYYRLPQLSLHYKLPWIEKFDITGVSDFAYFKRPIDDGSALEQSAGRMFNKITAAYPINRAWGYVTPAVSLQHLYTQYDQETVLDNNYSKDNKSKSIFVPEYSLDMGLNFFKAGSPWDKHFTGGYQLISPRLKYVYAPYEDQTDVPNFNTRLASLNFPQLYENSWFLGYDRIPDNNHLTPSVNYRYIDGVGLTRLDASIGQRIYLEDSRVVLDANQQPINSGRSATVMQLSSQPRQDFWVDLDGAVNSDGSLNYYNGQFRYQPTNTSLYNLGFVKRRANEFGQKDLSAITASAIFPIRNGWSFLGAVQYDNDRSRFSDALAGVTYESCCYGLSIYGRSYYNELDSTDKPTRAIMAEISLNGISNRRSGRLSGLMSDRVLGYNQLQSF